jgi:hypothetical protein
MSQGNPAGWYPDGQGATRYWDGTKWTDQARKHDGAPAEPATDAKEGAFARFKRAAADRSAEKRDSKEAQKRKWAEDQAAAGALVTSGTFGLSVVEIYEGGYVRVASGEQPDRPNIGNARAQMAQNLTGVGIGAKTPYEKLRSITFTPAASAVGGGSSALEGAVGPAVANLLKGTKHLVKTSAPGLAAAGIAHVASQGSRTSYLTITTDRQIYTLSNQIPNSVGLKTAKQAHVDVGLALAAAGNGVLGTDTRLAPEADTPAAAEPAVASESAPQSAAPSLADRLRELAILHEEGVLSDEEFAGAKARLLSGL